MINNRRIIPFIHIMLTFLFERAIFHFSWENIEFRTSIPKNYYIGDKTEMVLTYGLSKMFAVIIILLLWKIIFSIRDRKIESETIKIFGSIFFVGIVVGLLLYPSTFGLEPDNFAVYALAVRFLPIFWHSIYTGALYAGYMMIIPHPIAIFIFQWFLVVAVVGYIFQGVSEITNGKRIKYITLLFFILPETYELVFDAYRNNYYTLLCLFYFSFIFFSYKSKKKLSLKEFVLVGIFSAFLMVWRSEGLFIGLGGMLFLMIYNSEHARKTIITIAVVFLCSFLLLNNIQKIGAKKYYGNDYMMINTTGVLYNILNDPNANLDYDGAQEDLSNINDVIPAQALKEYAIAGYRNYNYTIGHLDGNQTLASDEAAKKYMRAYYRLVFHNFDDYLLRQISCLCYAMELDFSPVTNTFNGESLLSLDSFEYTQRDIGRDELYNTYLTNEWNNNNVRLLLSNHILNTINGWKEFTKKVHLIPVLNVFAVVYVLVMMLKEVCNGLRHATNDKYLLFFTLIVIIELCAIVAFLPEGRPYYLFPMLYSCYLLIYLRFVRGE